MAALHHPTALWTFKKSYYSSSSHLNYRSFVNVYYLIIFTVCQEGKDPFSPTYAAFKINSPFIGTENK
jgi:hypothetical protein